MMEGSVDEEDSRTRRYAIMVTPETKALDCCSISRSLSYSVQDNMSSTIWYLIDQSGWLCMHNSVALSGCS
jgi:hypothetical protein